jgi:hypothetical protein
VAGAAVGVGVADVAGSRRVHRATMLLIFAVEASERIVLPLELIENIALAGGYRRWPAKQGRLSSTVVWWNGQSAL